MKERWTAKIEFNFDVETEPSKPRHDGDAQVDFATRAIEEGFLPRLRKAFPGTDGVSWHCYPNSIRRIDK